MRNKHQSGWTFIELVITISIIGILSAIAFPRFADQARVAKIATLQGIAGSIKSTIAIMKGKALIAGATRRTNPPGADEYKYIVETEAGSSEVDYRNLCPESRAELGDKLSIIDLIGLEHNNALDIQINNRFTQIGYDIRGGGSRGCYISYDSFATPNCTIELIIADC